jgi:predicted amidohydrolase YtcJ
VDGHAGLVNAKALELAGVTAKTPDPDGGKFLRDAQGNPTGVLIDRAQQAVSSKIPSATPQELREATLAGITEANKWGLTGVHDAGEPAEVIDVFVQLAKEGKYNLRNYVMLRAEDSVLDRFMAQGPIAVNDRVWVHSIKITADGALGSRGAAMIEPYTDDPTNVGLITVPPDRIHQVAARALKAGWQVNVHAIGDRANRLVLDQFEMALKEVPKADHRFRVEHAQILHWDDIPRFAQLGVIPSMQGSHATSDMYWAVNRIGPTRALGAYAWRSLLNTGVVIPNGSDTPVESPNPLISFHSFITRQDADNWPAGGWYAEQKTTREEALLSMTMWPAYASFLEKESGSLSPGKFGDFVVLDQDIMTIPENQILNTKVEMTVLGGKVVYQRGKPVS